MPGTDHFSIRRSDAKWPNLILYRNDSEKSDYRSRVRTQKSKLFGMVYVLPPRPDQRRIESPVLSLNKRSMSIE